MSDLIQLPALPETPPDILNPPDPSVDPHAYNLWVTKTEGWKWLVGQHTRREAVLQSRAAELERRAQIEAMQALITSIGETAADYFDALEKGREVKAADLFIGLLERMQIRPGDTDANIPSQIDKTVRALLAQIQQYRTEGV